ncbi:hypothetical protein [Ancylobacter polymorphus]|uniref:Uncharacterized protein n=1 Tax=Ancylobacter polymorphus TaxID=223390 RepID=A0A9E7A667_9HYPH|nr:hypothetical protein [Ancylobacter polymorphus]UOK70338.1 hypothetical protein K9D25_16635 [Ancylobacter polymorphus]
MRSARPERNASTSRWMSSSGPYARGHGLLTDDLAVIDPRSGMVAPGAPAVRLWSASTRMSGDATPDERRVKAAREQA